MEKRNIRAERSGDATEGRPEARLSTGDVLCERGCRVRGRGGGQNVGGGWRKMEGEE